ncbi:MAG: mucoidy inhibitor MuiA family protein [Flavobacteriales bacterium]|nr:mucoidy inhibitor MuiA family protein [Flavobacteriales bacterium]
MPTRIILIALFFLPFSLFAEKEITVQSSVAEVTLYQQSAHVTRAAKVNLPQGQVLLKFDELHENINPNLVKFSGKGDFSILAVYHNYKIDTISGRDNARKRVQYQKQRQQLVEEMQREQSFLDIFTRELTLLQNHQNFTRPDSGLRVSDLAAAADFMRNRYFDIRKQQIEIEDRVKELNKQIQEIDVANSLLGGVVVNRSLEMFVRVNSRKSQQANLKLSYQMQSAGWYPSYDARVDNIEEPLALEFTASVYQNTGEDWSKVNLTVATGNPNLNTKKPNLLPWYLAGNRPAQPSVYSPGANPNQHLQSMGYNSAITSVTGRILDQHGEPIPFATVVVSGTSTGTNSDMNGYYQLDVPTNGRTLTYSYVGYNNLAFNISMPIMNVVMQSNTAALNEVTIQAKSLSAVTESYISTDDASWDGSGSLFKQRDRVDEFVPQADYAPVRVAYSPINTKYNIETPYTVPSDGKRYAVTLKTYEMEADYIYQCAPKLDKTAYLTAQVSGWEEYNLLAGTMNIYFEDTYIGQSNLDIGFTDDTLDISLGADPSIIIERKRINAKSSRQVIGSKRKDVREWEVTVRNNKNQEIRIQIEDQLPITHEDDIEIERESLSGGKVDEITGMIVWDLRIGRGKSKKVDFKYSIKYPKNMLLAWQ